ncbi:hypothetical protein FMEAI12_3580021 [Parafrankia sp. Ea1.12]|nr:hypothetical protein FMEAI12_3580021 [Parafrankia sp. Ea1.12]
MNARRPAVHAVSPAQEAKAASSPRDCPDHGTTQTATYRAKHPEYRGNPLALWRPSRRFGPDSAESGYKTARRKPKGE